MFGSTRAWFSIYACLQAHLVEPPARQELGHSIVSTTMVKGARQTIGTPMTRMWSKRCRFKAGNSKATESPKYSHAFPGTNCRPRSRYGKRVCTLQIAA